MLIAQCQDINAWQTSPGYQRKPHEDSNGLITTIPATTMPDLPAATLASLPKLSIAGKGATTPSI